jgi:hypothetical protein
MKKRGAMEIEEIIKILIVVTILVVLIGGAVFLLGDKGSSLIQGIKDAFKFR